MSRSTITTTATITAESTITTTSTAISTVTPTDGVPLAVRSDAEPNGLPLLAWLSPGFPVGAFAYSHGLETAVDDGDIRNAADLSAWLIDLLDHGSVRNDAVLVRAAWAAGNAGALRDINDLALALAPSRERRLETAATGTAFAVTIRTAWQAAVCAFLPEGEIAYPVAFGATCAVEKLPLLQSLGSYGLAFVQNLVSAAVRLGPVGQTDGQRTIVALLPATERLARFASTSTIDDLGGAAFRSDIAALRHETQYSRLFRS